MSTLTPELNLVQGQDDDDTADYLTIDLANSLNIIDGLFNSGTGHKHGGSHQGGALNPATVFPDNSLPGAKLVDGSVTAAKLSAGALLPEALYANTTVSQGTNYTVAATIMYVFCTAAITVTLPAAASANRPITVIGVTGISSVASAGGSVFGGSADPVTGAVTNGQVRAPESFTYKSDGTNWRAV